MQNSGIEEQKKKPETLIWAPKQLCMSPSLISVVLILPFH